MTGTGTRARHRVRSLATGLLFAAFLAAYAASPIRTSADSRWSVHTAMSFLQGKAGRLDDYAPVIEAEHTYAIVYREGHPYTIFPVGTSLLSTPFVLVADLVSPSFGTYLKTHVPAEFEGLVASVFGALAGCLFFRVAAERFGSFPVGLALSAIFCFGTSMWSTATRALWQHGPLVFVLTAALLMLVRARHNPALIGALGLPLALGFVIRPTAAIPILVLSGYVLVCHRGSFLRYLAGAALVAVPWLAFNLASFGHLLPSYYMPERLSGSATVGTALLGNLFSPGRGLFVFSPVLLLAIPGFAASLRDRADRALHLSLGAIVVLHWVFVSRFPQWWGDYCFGPRLMTDILPFITYFAGFAVQHILARLTAWRRLLAAGTALALAATSILVHAQGATRWAPYLWSAQPSSIDEHPERLWDWSDLQFTRGLRHPVPMPDFGPLLPGFAWGRAGNATGLQAPAHRPSSV